MNKHNKKRMSEISKRLNELHQELREDSQVMESQSDSHPDLEAIIEEIEVLEVEYRDLESKNAS